MPDCRPQDQSIRDAQRVLRRPQPVSGRGTTHSVPVSPRSLRVAWLRLANHFHPCPRGKTCLQTSLENSGLAAAKSGEKCRLAEDSAAILGGEHAVEDPHGAGQEAEHDQAGKPLEPEGLLPQPLILGPRLLLKDGQLSLDHLGQRSLVDQGDAEPWPQFPCQSRRQLLQVLGHGPFESEGLPARRGFAVDPDPAQALVAGQHLQALPGRGPDRVGELLGIERFAVDQPLAAAGAQPYRSRKNAVRPQDKLKLRQMAFEFEGGKPVHIPEPLQRRQVIERGAAHREIAWIHGVRTYAGRGQG